MKRRSLQKRSEGFTLLEIMVVVIIIGVLAATIIPQFMGTTHDAKVSAAKGDVAQLESAMERFNLHMDRFPTMDEGLNVLVEAPAGEDKKWRGPYIKVLRPDPWGNPYQYRAPGMHHSSTFDVWSRGADGQDGGEGPGADIGNW
jgi:general secretion pathway protein G